MNKIVPFLLLLIGFSAAAQESINFENKTFQEILAQAKKEKKLIFLDAYASWCGPCKMMEKNVFPLKAVKEYFNSNFINAHFDMEKGEGRDIARKYGIRSYPTYLFLNGDGEVVLKNFGYMEEHQFLTFAKEANNPKLQNTSYKTLFEKGESDPEFLLNMMRVYSDSDYELAKKASERFFAGKKDALTREDVGLLLYFLKSPTDANYKVFTARKAEIEKIMSAEVYQQFDVNIKISKILENSLDQKTGAINDDYFYSNAIPLVGKKDAETALNRMKVMYYPNVGNFAGYEKAALAYYQNADLFDPEELLKAAWIFSEQVSNPTALKEAQNWAERSVMKGETPENTYILAKIYAKLGKTEDAKNYAEMSKHLAETQGKDTTLTTQLLNTLK